MIEKVKKILCEPVTCQDGCSHYMDESQLRNLASRICQLFELKFNNVLEADAHNWDTRELQMCKDCKSLEMFIQNNALRKVYEAKIKQARQEMIEEIEGHWELVAEENHLPYFRFDYGRWQELKRGVK